MKITNIDTFVEEFRNGRDIWSRPAIELAVREIERLQKENNKLKLKLAASENDLVLSEVSEMLKKTQARVQELEEALTKIARYQSLRFRLSPYEYGLLEQIIGIAEHALRDGE